MRYLQRVQHNSLKGTLETIILKFKQDSLFRNSVYLMLSTAVQAGLGFIFWIFAARLYTAEEVGIGTAMIAVSTLITNFSLFGFNSSFIRFLPNSKQKNETVNTGIVIVALFSMVFTIIYLTGINIISPKLGFITDNPWTMVLFVIFTAIDSINTLTDSVFIAYRSSVYNFIVYTAYSIIKLLAVVLLVGMGSYGVFFAYIGAIVVATTLSLYFMIRKFNYIPKINISKKIVNKMARYSFANYLATFFAYLPSLLFPIMILNFLGAKQSAQYYLATMIANLLYVIPTATTLSLFAEGSHDNESIARLVRQTIKTTAFIIIPATIAIVVSGQFILLIFGKEYSTEATRLLQVLALISPLVALTFVCNTVLKIKDHIKGVLVLNICFAIFTITSAYILRAHLLGFGIALAIGYSVALILGTYFIHRYRLLEVQ